MHPTKIVSLVPSATESLFLLGAGPRVRAVSHACDHPEEATRLPRATRARIDAAAPSATIDAAVRRLAKTGESPVVVLEDVLAHVQPDLVVAQTACGSCGVTPVNVRAAMLHYEPVDHPRIVSVDPHTLDDVIEDVVRLADAVGLPDAGRSWHETARARIDTVTRAVEGRERPRVLVLDWCDPPLVAGHWTPDLVRLAGGEPVLAEPGEPSRATDWTEIAEAAPDVVVVAPCGIDLARARKEAAQLESHAGWRDPGVSRPGRVVAMDGGATFSRGGPRLVEVLEGLVGLLHGG